MVTYDNQAAFLAALPGPASTLNFESPALGFPVPSGSPVSGITFTYSITGLSMSIVNQFTTTSGNQFLGLSDPTNFDQLFGGDEFHLALGTPSVAVGLYFVTGNALAEGDILLQTSAGVAQNTANYTLLSDGGRAYFIGLVSTGPSFSSADIAYGPTAMGAFAFNVDDITTSVQPGSGSSINGGGTQSTTAGTPFGAALSVVIRDALGNPINKYPVVFTAPAQSGASALFGGTGMITINTSSTGIASTSASANALAGNYNVTATAGRVTLNFNLTNTATPAVTASATPPIVMFSTNSQQIQLNASVNGGTAGTVNAGNVTITITDPANNVYNVGTATVSNGAIPLQTFTVRANPAFGLWSIVAAFTGGGAFLNKNGAGSFTVGPANNIITFPQPLDTPLTSGPVTLMATASSGLAPTYTSNSSTICSIVNDHGSLLMTGVCSITARQAGNPMYFPATPVTRSFQVTQGIQSINFGSLPNQGLGTPPFAVNATATSGLAVTFTSTTLPICTVSRAIVTLVALGQCSIQASQAGSPNYAAAIPVTQSFQVTQGRPVSGRIR